MNNKTSEGESHVPEATPSVSAPDEKRVTAAAQPKSIWTQPITIKNCFLLGLLGVVCHSLHGACALGALGLFFMAGVNLLSGENVVPLKFALFLVLIGLAGGALSGIMQLGSACKGPKNSERE